MVLEAFAHDRLYYLQWISGRINSENYKSMLHNHPILFAFLIAGAKRMFLRVNTSCHVSKSTQEWLLKRKSWCFVMPSGSLNLNPLKIFGIICSSANELWVFTLREWHNIPELKILVISMEDRMLEIVSKNKRRVSYINFRTFVFGKVFWLLLYFSFI